MQRNKSITRYKQKLLLFLSALFILLLIQPNLTTYAYTVEEAAVGKALAVDVIGNSNSSGNTTTPNGITYTRTGYLCYILNADGSNPGLPTYAFKSPGYSELSGSEWIAVTRKGTTHTGGWKAVAPWNITPYTATGSGSSVQCITNEPEIKAWFQSPDSGVDNSMTFIDSCWGEEAVHRFGNDEYILVIETLLNFQYTVPGEAIDDDFILEAKYQARAKVYEGGELWDVEGALLPYCFSNGYKTVYKNYKSSVGTARDQFIESLRGNIVQAAYAAIDDMYANSSGESRTLVGSPFIGTVPNILDYKSSYPEVGTWYDSYTNKTVPFAERIIPGGPGEKAGFKAWTGSTSSRISDAEVKAYGLAMMVITASTSAQTTCDESLAPTPHNPPKESEGKVTIVKSYRDKINGEYTDRGTYSTPDLGTQILIENEQVYQVVAWKTSTTTNTSITSINWNPPSSIIQQGTAPNSVTLQPNETCLYVLLEKVEEEDIPEEDYNYLLSESSITRTVWFS